jgi:hypothetical protein
MSDSDDSDVPTAQPERKVSSSSESDSGSDDDNNRTATSQENKGQKKHSSDDSDEEGKNIRSMNFDEALTTLCFWSSKWKSWKNDGREKDANGENDEEGADDDDKADDAPETRAYTTKLIFGDSGNRSLPDLKYRFLSQFLNPHRFWRVRNRNWFARQQGRGR